jgi:uncharacterized phiE125 gp8 family phage protein
MAGLRTVTEPAVEPITVIEAREHLRLDDDVDKSQVMSYIVAVREWAENYTGRHLISRSMQMYLDGASQKDTPLWEGMRTGVDVIDYQNFIEFDACPVQSVTSIKYYNDDDTENTWATSNYYVDTISQPAKIVLRTGGTFPTDLRPANGLEINFISGYGDNNTDVPEAIRVAMLQYMTFIYEHRGDYEKDIKEPAILRSLLQPYQTLRFGGHSYSKMFKSGIS